MEPPGLGSGVQIVLSAPVYPTESGERVAQAMQALFPTAELATEPNRVSGRLPRPDVLGDLIQRMRIPDTARSQLMKGRAGGRSVVFLNKQAAAAGRLNFATVPGPLGDIRLEITAPDEGALEAFILSCAPDTTVPTYEWPKGRDPDVERPGSPYSARPAKNLEGEEE